MPRCQCDPARADHVVQEVQVHRDTDTATLFMRAVCCGARWTDEVTMAQYDERMEAEHDPFAGARDDE